MNKNVLNKLFSIVTASILSLSIVSAFATYAIGVSAKANLSVDETEVSEYDYSDNSIIDKSLVECDENIEMAEKISGMDIVLPASNDYSISACEGLISVDYFSTELDKDITFSKINDYSDIIKYCPKYQKPVVNVDDRQITLFVDNGSIYGGFWEENGYTYGIMSNDNVSLNEISIFINSIENSVIGWNYEMAEIFLPF